jgi:poly(A) polymerase
MFLDPDGTIHDPVGGLLDLRARRVRFVGDPATRLAEDVLRLLRYYRFEARFGTGNGDAQARAACRAAAHLLSTLSGERLQQELIKLLETPDPLAGLRMMRDDGVLAVAVPEARHLDRLRQLILIEGTADPLLRLAALIEVDGKGAVALAARLRFSNVWRDRLCGLSPPRPIDPEGDVRTQRRALHRLGVERYRDVAALIAAERGMSRNRLTELLDLARGWTPPVFPLAGRDVIALGIPAGERVGRLLSTVHDWWEEGNFIADRAACLAQLRDLAMHTPA